MVTDKTSSKISQENTNAAQKNTAGRNKWIGFCEGV